jgi:hypothetical protein
MGRLGPTFEGFTVNSFDDVRARWGYINDFAGPADVAIGPKNKFTPSPENRGQPTNFLPGRQRSVFSTALEGPGKNLVWTLETPVDGSRRTATAGYPNLNLKPSVICTWKFDGVRTPGGPLVENRGMSFRVHNPNNFTVEVPVGNFNLLRYPARLDAIKDAFTWGNGVSQTVSFRPGDSNQLIVKYLDLNEILEWVILGNSSGIDASVMPNCDPPPTTV